MASRRRRGRRMSTESGLSITSLMDMMTIILVFLLTNWGTNVLPVQPSDDFQLPTSSATDEPKVAVIVIVTRSDVFVDGERVLSLGATDEPGVGVGIPAGEMDGRTVKVVYDRLVAAGAAARQARDAAVPAPAPAAGSDDDEGGFEGDLLLQLDRRTPFAVMRDLMYTAGQAGFSRFRFVVVSDAVR